MKNLKLLTGLLLMLLLCSFAAAEWVTYGNKAEGFSIQFPKQPEVSREPVMGSKATMLTYMVGKAEDDNMLYSMGYIDMPDKGVLSEASEEKLNGVFDKTIKGVIGKRNFKTLSEQRTRYGKYPGRAARMNINDGVAYAYIKLYAIKNRLYILTVMCKPTNDNNASIKRFFTSFVVQ